MQCGTLCYIRDNDKTLMLHRTKKENDMHDGMRVGVGGKLEEGESPTQCVRREVHEETGLTIMDPILKGMFTITRDAFGGTWHVFVYRVDAWHGELIDCPEGDLERVETASLPDLNMRDADKIFTQRLDEPGVFAARFAVDGSYDVDWYARDDR